MVIGCGAFDSGLTIHPDGKVSPCCQFEKAYFKDLQDINLDAPWEDLKDGKGCNACKHHGPTYKDTFDKFKENDWLYFLLLPETYKLFIHKFYLFSEWVLANKNVNDINQESFFDKISKVSEYNKINETVYVKSLKKII